jgi:hypothetical protein
MVFEIVVDGIAGKIIAAVFKVVFQIGITEFELVGEGLYSNALGEL